MFHHGGQELYDDFGAEENLALASFLSIAYTFQGIGTMAKFGSEFLATLMITIGIATFLQSQSL